MTGRRLAVMKSGVVFIHSVPGKPDWWRKLPVGPLICESWHSADEAVATLAESVPA